mmetsp:Transcript_65667/g.203605  ORF Transcript_65667/g.203605 Transcript_65667/m.203605 type:complete len:216 (-) Transcript_65667:262-909(-)
MQHELPTAWPTQEHTSEIWQSPADPPRLRRPSGLPQPHVMSAAEAPAAAAAPSSGPVQKIHMSAKVSRRLSRSFATSAGPNERVGLMEHPSMGTSTECARKTARPIAKHAWARLGADSGFVAVSRTTKTRRKVISVSPMRALSCGHSLPTALEPRPPVLSFSAGYTASRSNAPVTEPSSCPTTFTMPCRMVTWPTSTRPKVTAQLMCPPLRCPVA